MLAFLIIIGTAIGIAFALWEHSRAPRLQDPRVVDVSTPHQHAA